MNKESEDMAHLISPKSYGSWTTEEESQKFFSELIEKTGLFRQYREVVGDIIQPRMETVNTGVRIDFILSPTPKLITLGWEGGPIGVECKRSGEDLSKAFVQALDYSRTIWTVNGYRFMCKYFFVWPFKRVVGFPASVMCQLRVGNIKHRDLNGFETVKFQMGPKNVISWDGKEGSASVNSIKSGNKTGSR